ncbi:MAG: IPT/TIG domain-containing protein, partial [Candidatus Sericytochromatia bacterium]
MNLKRIALQFCALSLAACQTVPHSGSSPATPAPTQASSPASSQVQGPGNAPAAPASPQEAGELTVRLQAEQDLLNFRTGALSPFALCLGDVSEIRIRIELPTLLSAQAQAALRGRGVTLETAGGANGEHSVLSLKQALENTALLVEGIDFTLAHLPAGPIEARLSFHNAAGQEFGFYSFSAQLLPAGNLVGLRLSRSGIGSNGCPLVSGELSGGGLLGAGGLVQSPAAQPNATPAPQPSAGTAQPAPTGLQLVEQTSNSLTLLWDFPTDASSFKVYLDGRLVADNHVYPNYFRFEGLNRETRYQLGVQATGPDGESPIVSLFGTTLGSGHSGSGSFSGGGGSGGPAASPRPGITDISPASGVAAGGTSVTLTGTDFSNATAVNFGANPATSFTVDSATQITAVAPAGTGSVNVTVTTPNGTSAISLADQFTYAAVPSITGRSPTSGSTAGGTSVVLTGTSFTGATAVNFGATPATSFTVDSATQITAVAPASFSSTVDVTVTTPGGTSVTSAADQFTFINPPGPGPMSPNIGPLAGGNVVTIVGVNLSNVTSVTFGANPAIINANTPTSITVTPPAGTGSVTVTVSNAVGSGTTNSQYTYINAPTLTGMNT